MFEIDYEAVYEKLRQIILEEETYQSVVEVIETARSEMQKNRKEIQAKGIARAKAEQVSFGRPRIPKPKDYRKIMDLYLSGKVTMIQAASLMNVSRSLCYSWICEERNKLKEVSAED